MIGTLAIECRDLYTPYLATLRRSALQGVSCTIKAGEFVVLLGLNGAGKSTWLRSLLGLIPIQTGTIAINEVPLVPKTLTLVRRDIGILYQGGALVPQLTALENVLCGCLGQRSPWQTLLGFSRRDRYRALDCLEKVGLDNQGEQKTSLLSGGQRQRVAIARLLMQSPKILLVDEPTAGLDVQAARQVMEILLQLNRQGVTIVTVLHDLELAQAYARRAIVLEHGAIAFDGICENLATHFAE